MNAILIIIASLYLLLIGGLTVGMFKVNPFVLKPYPPNIKFSIVIALRNESANLKALLRSIKNLNYLSEYFEVLLINDESNDNSLEVITDGLRDLNLLNVAVFNTKRITNAPKKDAIKTGIENAKFEWILTTDADCILPEDWLSNFNSFIQEEHPSMIVSPVTYHEISSFLDHFQILDFLSLQGATIGGFGINCPFLCNGANFAYTKSLFSKVDGFKGNTKIASGDDVFLMEKALKHEDEKVSYLKSKQQLVLTRPESSFSKLVQQRKRWASKSTHYSNYFGKVTGLIVLMMNFIVVVYPLGLIFSFFNLKLFLLIFSFKLVVDFALIYFTASLFDQKKYLKSYFISCIIYPFFVIFISISSLFSNYKWKQRTFSK